MENTGHHFISVSRELDILDDDFRVYSNPDNDDVVVIPAGTYEWTGLFFNLSTDSRKALRFRGGGQLGAYYNGQRASANLSTTWQPNSHFTADLSLNRNSLRDIGSTIVPVYQADNPDDVLKQRFTTSTISLRAQYAFTPDLFVKGYLQYNDSRNAIVSNYLLHGDLPGLQ